MVEAVGYRRQGKVDCIDAIDPRTAGDQLQFHHLIDLISSVLQIWLRTRTHRHSDLWREGPQRRHILTHCGKTVKSI